MIKCGLRSEMARLQNRVFLLNKIMFRIALWKDSLCIFRHLMSTLNMVRSCVIWALICKLKAILKYFSFYGVLSQSFIIFNFKQQMFIRFQSVRMDHIIIPYFAM